MFDITSADGTKMRATWFPAAKPGPGALMVHMCNTTRKSWESVARGLSQAGISALTVAQESLSDGYIALGDKPMALVAEEKCLELLPADKSSVDFKAQLKPHAEERAAQLKAEAKTQEK